MCCQESGEREATVALFCPKAAYDEPKIRKVVRLFLLLMLEYNNLLEFIFYLQKVINKMINLILIYRINNLTTIIDSHKRYL